MRPARKYVESGTALSYAGPEVERARRGPTWLREGPFSNTNRIVLPAYSDRWKRTRDDVQHTAQSARAIEGQSAFR